MKQVVSFDLDYTLFDVEQYYSGAFRLVADRLVSGDEQDRLFVALMEHWKHRTSRYPRLFDDVLIQFGIKHAVPQAVEAFNSYRGNLAPYEDAVMILESLTARGIDCAVVTDGQPERQRWKIAELGLSKFISQVVCTAELGEPKPSPVPFFHLKEILPADRFLFVGDNPDVDVPGARTAGYVTVWIRRGEFSLGDALPDYEIESLLEVNQLV